MKRVIQMLILLIAMYLPSIVWSHQVVGNDRYDTPGKIAEIEKYFKERYNLELDRHVVVILEPSTKAYSRRLQSLKVKDYESIAYRSQALTSKENVIVIDCSGLSDRSYMFFLAHELVHQYQFQLLKEKTTEDMVAVEGLADIIASDISLEDMLEERLEDRFSRYLYRPCPGKHFFYEVSKELNLISDPTTTELNSSSVISPNGQSIPMYDLLFGKIPGCRVEKLSEYSYQVNVTIPMSESVKIDIRCGNEAPLPPSVFFAQGESIDLRDIAEEIDVPEYTFSQPNYLRDMQDPRDIPDPQDPEPSTEALLGDNLDQLMRYSRLSGYRGDHFVNN